ncbi:Zn-dependent hydrolase [Aeromicrobium ponti]|uniref:N-carbamoyl-L-amino-acid hydrolase n=1 Tax=Cytobacillus oceanisediminis TaxID=665099 RepID=A0A562K2N6_9BACI|nr:M20 family metallo-hydrolase [Cytobacillus oceanisediminis]TWH89606.1 N-carbamoyl-L-amino-acid hydrolase [Cytobacillus oceanisediminis]
MVKHQVTNIKLDRLMKTIQQSAEIGTLPNGGICRLSLTDEDQKMRSLFLQWMKDCGLETRVDDFGNMYGRRKGRNNERAPVLAGSHLDTQPKGGKYDGVLGVLGALEVIRTLNDLGIETERPIEIVNFTNEEGARFQPAMLGSGAMAEIFNKQTILNMKDQKGFIFGEELERIGYKGLKENRQQDPFCFVELHIEQGPVLEDREKSIGVVTGIQGMSWLEAAITGRTSHTGTTPMNRRKDAVLLASKLIAKIYALAEEIPDLLVAVGRIQAFPNVINTVADQVVFSIDIRHPDDHVRERFEQQVKESLSTMTLVEGMELQIKDLDKIDTDSFSKEIIEVMEDAAEKHSFSYMRMLSGAGHDAKYLNRITPTAMLFIPSINGLSHCEEEFSTPEDIEKGVQVLFDTVLTLANKETL